MLLKALAPLIKASGPLPRAYYLYGDEETIALTSEILKAFLRLRYPSLKMSSLESTDQVPVPDLFGGGTSGPTLYSVKKNSEEPDFLKGQDFFLFTPNRLTQKSPFVQKHKSNSDIAFVACYEASFLDFKALLFLMKKQFDQESMVFLESYYRLFPMSVVGLLDKLPYLPETINREMIQRLLPEEEESRCHLLVDAFFTPSSSFQERLQVTALQETDFIPFSRIFISACQKLHQLLFSLEGGEPLRSALFSLRYPLFFDKQAFFSRSLKKGNSEVLTDLYNAFLDFETDLMKGRLHMSAVVNKLTDAHKGLFSGNEASKTIK